MRQRGHSHRHGGDEGAGQPQQQLHRRQEERQVKAQPAADGEHRCVPDQHAEGEPFSSPSSSREERKTRFFSVELKMPAVYFLWDAVFVGSFG